MPQSSGSFCAVALCNNSTRKKRNAGRNDLTFHRFPKDHDIRREWIKSCRRNDHFNPDCTTICSDHFKPSYFKQDLKAELLHYSPSRRYLEKNAVPTENLPVSFGTPQTKSGKKRHEKQLAKIAKASQEELITAALSFQNNFSQKVIDCSHPLNYVHNDTPNDNDPAQFENLNDKYNLLEQKYIQCRTELLSAKAQLKNKVVKANRKLLNQNFMLRHRLKHKIKLLKRKEQLIKILRKNEKERVSLALKKILGKCFSDNQIKIISGKQTKVHWTSEDISKAFTLRYFSQKTYLYVRNDLHYPLPGMTSLRIWARRIEMRNGVLRDVLHIMSSTKQDLCEKDKLTVISFDEMKVDTVLEYDQLHDQVLGPHNQMQVIMARGLCAKWKQPLYVDFDKRMTRDLLFEVIQVLHDIGYPVVACVSDMGAGNRALANELGVGYLNPTFQCGNFSQKIAYFPDGPHLLKLFRNWLLDTGFILRDGRIVNKEPLQKLVSLVGKEITVCHKLTERHVECKGNERQNVRLAAELISHTTATALKHYAQDINSDFTEATSEIIDLFDKWFSMMNVYVPSTPATQFFNAPFSGTEEQIDLLDTVYSVVEGMRCAGKGCLQVFQKGILQSVNALKSLFTEMKALELQYILTHKLNQNVLENLFSQVRTRGGLDDHPSPLSALHRLRIIILGKTPGVIKQNTNTASPSNEDFIVASVMKKMDITTDEESPEHISSETDTASENEEETAVCANTVYIKPPSSDTDIASESEEYLYTPDGETVSKDGIVYLAGWLARKFKKKHPELGQYSKDMKLQCEHDYTLPDWITHLSYRGLTIPSQKFRTITFKAEKLLRSEWKDDLPRTKGIVKETTNALFQSLKKNISKEVVKAFVKQRLFIRIKYKNLHSQILARKRRVKFQLKRAAKLRKLL